MQIQINTDSNVHGHAQRAAALSKLVEDALHRFRGALTRVEVHVSDQNSEKKGGGDDLRCVLEARMEGRPPIAVTHDAANVGQAVDGAAGKLARKIESIQGRQRAQQNQRPPEPRPESGSGAETEPT